MTAVASALSLSFSFVGASSQVAVPVEKPRPLSRKPAPPRAEHSRWERGKWVRKYWLLHWPACDTDVFNVVCIASSLQANKGV